MYRVCTLQLHHICLLFLVVSGGVSGFSKSPIMSSAQSDTFTSSFPIRMPFLSLPCRVVLARTSRAVLGESGGSGPPCLFLVPRFRGGAFSFSPLSLVLAEGLSLMACLVFRDFPFIPILLSVLITDGRCSLSNIFFCIYR